MKRVSAFLLCLLLIGALVFSCAAAPVRVRTDTALSERESAYLDTLFEAVLDAYGIEAFFVINYDYSGGDDFTAYVSDYLAANKQTADAMIFAVSAENYRLHSLGKAKTLLQNGDITTLYAAIADADASGEQYTAAVQFYTALNTLLAERMGVEAAELPAPPAGEKVPDAAQIVCVRTDDELSEQRQAHLQTLFDAIRDEYGIEVFFVINYEYVGGDAFKEYLRSYLEKNEQSDNSMIFAVSADDYRMIRSGKAKDLLTNDDMDTLYDAIADADASGEQYSAAVQFYAALDQMLAARTGGDGTGADFTEIWELVPGSVPIPDEISPVRGDRLVDQADLLSPEAEAALQAKLDCISEQLQFDVVIVTCEHIGNRSPMEFADDYFDYNGFGYGEDHDGVALLISMADRDWWVSTCGYGETALQDDYFLDCIDPSEFTDHLKDGNYDKSFNFFVDMVEKFVTEAKTNKPYSERHRYHERKSMIKGMVWPIIIGIVAAALVTSYKYNNYTGSVRMKGEADEYMVGGLSLREQRDEFRYSKVTRVKRVQESSSGSSGSSHHSSGSHRSSSGRSHGGGGGKF